MVLVSSEKQKVYVKLGQGLPSQSFHVDLIGAANQFQIANQDNEMHALTVRTELSLTSPNEEFYTKVTTISPQFVLVNKTTCSMLVAQELNLHQAF